VERQLDSASEARLYLRLIPRIYPELIRDDMYLIGTVLGRDEEAARREFNKRIGWLAPTVIRVDRHPSGNIFWAVYIEPCEAAAILMGG
jgi:hypothetical protein